MKTRVLKICMLCVAMLTAQYVLTYAQDNDLKKLAGEWSYSMPDMMGGGDPISGTCKIATVNGETKATLSNPMGEVTSSALKLENGKYAGTLDIPDFELKVVFYLNGDKLMQELISDFGEMPAIEMTRIK
ncbi:MAG: hypothetical protein LBS05_06810 [Tannerellaceae bacterium]|jgi:hypothetical protein|nr:hypothetical protein [Tannerellaceae bacterium]